MQDWGVERIPGGGISGLEADGGVVVLGCRVEFAQTLVDERPAAPVLQLVGSRPMALQKSSTAWWSFPNSS